MIRYVEVPYTALSAAALEGLIEEFITREGTEYGHKEHALPDMRAGVRKQIERGLVTIVFDPDSETTTLINRSDLVRLSAREDEAQD
ncbi:MAG TPA: YheU family protein [Polyangiales bacterium]